MTFERIGVDSLPALAALSAASLVDAPNEQELRETLFWPGLEANVLGDPDVAVVATVERGGQGYIRWLVVHPDHRGRGRGSALLERAEEALAHLPSITVGSDVPDHLVLGVTPDATALAALLERRHYRRVDARVNMTVDLTAIDLAIDDPRVPTGDR